MPAHLFIGAGAGLVSAALFGSAVVSGALAGLILYLAPLPLCLAGLGWGRPAAGLGALVGTVLAILFLGPAPGLVYAASIAAPSAVLVYLILQSRTLPDPENKAAQIIAWYPVGHLVAAAAIMGGLIATMVVLLLGPDMARYQASVDQMMPVIHDAVGKDNDVWTPEVAEKLRAVLTQLLPAMMAVVWLTIGLLNIWLAGTIVRASGHAIRPWPDLHALEIPNAMVIAFAASLVMWLLPGIPGLIGAAFAGAFLFAYLLQGLAVIHFYTLGMPFRTVLLAIVYLAILLLGWVAIIVAIAGLGEPLFGSRARGAAAARSGDTGDGT
ncbi:DUF2232 domain-containing protein [Methyloceanibacter sp.]|uniref:DUF2232 domain-containing protein n=1 Tax=Methyloceanibacter sp. TaxID=1965321 RepID=UPI002BCA8B9F|nr:DUF2232 domain-containing protein [Methyloceanibacter sp.]HML92152.1 DUF2232 domain-containing protein [Methyloceanibacter sp.]